MKIPMDVYDPITKIFLLYPYLVFMYKKYYPWKKTDTFILFKLIYYTYVVKKFNFDNQLNT